MLGICFAGRTTQLNLLSLLAVRGPLFEKFKVPGAAWPIAYQSMQTVGNVFIGADVQTLVCPSKRRPCWLVWWPELTATSGELSRTARPLPRPCGTLWSMTCSFEHHRLCSSPHQKNTKDGFIKIPRKAPVFLFKPLYRGNLASQLQTSKPCPALQASESFFFFCGGGLFCLRGWMQSVLLKIKSLPVCFCANVWIKACRVYFKGAVFRGDVDRGHLEQGLHLRNHI